MAQEIRFRLTAAKVGVSMALLALIAGVAEKVQTRPVEVRTAQAAQFLKLTGIKGATRTAFLKLESKLLKLDSQFLKLERDLSAKYLKITDANGRFLKIGDAAQFLKIGDANSQFLKITDANGQFLKITDAYGQFLKITDANAQFLKVDGTAANAQEVGGISADNLLHGRGQVLSNSASVVAGSQQQLLGDGSVRVLVGLSQAGQPTITLENDTSSTLDFTVTGGTSQSNTIPPGGGQASVSPSSSQIDIQVFGPPGAGGKIWTVTVSEVNSEFVGQMLIGLL